MNLVVNMLSPKTLLVLSLPTDTTTLFWRPQHFIGPLHFTHSAKQEAFSFLLSPEDVKELVLGTS